MDAFPGTGGASIMTATEPQPWNGPAGTWPVRAGYDVVINSESCSYWERDELVSILSVHTVVCPLIRAELRGETDVRVLAYYHAATRLGLEAYESVLRQDPEVLARLGLRPFVQDTLNMTGGTLTEHLQDATVREMYLHEIIRTQAHSIATAQLHSDGCFTVSRLI